MFDQLQDEVARRLADTVDLEFARLPESDRVAAALAVKSVFDELDLSAEITRQDLDAARLVAAARPLAAAHFASLGGDSARLADVILTESCAYVVSLAGKLPDFQVAATRELLKRSTSLLAELTKVVDTVSKMRSEASDSKSREEAGFETQYRRALVFKLDRLHLFGLRLVGAGTREYELSIAYVTLTSTVVGARTSRDIDECLPPMRRAVVRGEAGSGKTTLMQWLAVRAANRDFAGELARWNALMPFYVRLRDYADTRLPTVERLIESVAPNLAGMMPAGWAHRALDAGALLVIDGVDELPAARRGEFFDWLRHLCEDFVNSVVIVSSRPAAMDASRGPATLTERLAGIGFEALALDAMTLHDSEALVTHWHAAVGRDRMSEEDRAKLQRYDVGLRKTLREKPSIQALASNPLMCAMICALNWDRQQDLPSQRMKLYELALVLLLQSRDADRQIQAAHLATLGPEAKEDILDALAYWMLRNGYSEAGRDDVEAQVGKVLKRLATINAPADEVTQELLERSGVLRQPQHGVVDFVHRTFLEYMAARAAVESDDLGVLVDRAKEESWRETIVFAAGHAQGKTRDKLITDLLRKPLLPFVPRAFEVDVTAVCCLETVSANLDPKLLQRLQERGRALFPPRDFASARILAPAAALDPSLLLGHEARGDEVISACIRCAATVARPEALDVIASYAAIDRVAVVDELLRSWTSFDSALYLERVVSRMPLARRLEVDPALAGTAETLRCLQLLVVRGEHDGDVDALSKALLAFRDDHALSVGSAHRVDDEAAESTAESLSARLFRTVKGEEPRKPATGRKAGLVSLADAERLAELPSLTTLTLGRCDRGVVAKLAVLPNLRRLSISGHDEPTIDAVSMLPELVGFALSGVFSAKPTAARPLDLRPLTRCPRLRQLSVSHLGEDEPDAMLVPLGNLEELDVTYAPLGFLALLDTARRLRSLEIQASSLPAVGLRHLAGLPALERLDIYCKQPLDLKLPTSLRKLRLSQSPHVRIAEPLALQGLEELVLVGIGGGSGLAELTTAPRLRWLSLNGIEDVDMLAAAEVARARGVHVSL